MINSDFGFLRKFNSKVSSTHQDQCNLNLPSTLNEINWVLFNRSSLFPGPAEIPYSFLYNLPTFENNFILYLCNTILYCGWIPNTLKHSIIVPILKLIVINLKPLATDQFIYLIQCVNCLKRSLKTRLR